MSPEHVAELKAKKEDEERALLAKLQAKYQ